MFNSLIKGLIIHGRVKASTARAKQIQVVVEKLITVAKEDNVANRRLAFSVLQSEDLVKKLFVEIAPKYADRNGGYIQFLKMGMRKGDGCPLSVISFLS